jgi:CheY-like chemotaxis protein
MKTLKQACIIDDDGIFVYATKRLMEIADFCEEVIVYRNGQEALDGLALLIQQGLPLPELVFLDINMPVLDGFQFLDIFSSWPLSAPIALYMVTSSINPEDMRKATSFSLVRSYISKPLSLETLGQIASDIHEGRDRKEI